MDTAKIRIHHAVFCHNAHTLGGQGLFNLLQVQHRFTYGPDREFPMRAGPRDLYLRFFVDRPGQMAISVRLWWLSDDRVNKEFVGECGAKAITFSPEIGVQDISIKIRDLVFPRIGTYALRVCRRSRKPWDADCWKVLSTEFIYVEHTR